MYVRRMPGIQHLLGGWHTQDSYSMVGWCRKDLEGQLRSNCADHDAETIRTRSPHTLVVINTFNCYKRLRHDWEVRRMAATEQLKHLNQSNL